MSSDEDEEPTGRTKRSALNKSGRNRMRTLADSSDEDEQLFDDPVNEDEEDDEEEDEDDDDDDDGQDNMAYSIESLRKAMSRLKSCMNPPMIFVESKFPTWEAVESQITKQQVTLKKLDELIQDISTSSLLSPEFKCLVAAIAANSCEIYKKEQETKKCQDFFKSKNKNDKSKHIANFVSNVWPKEALRALRLTKEENMHTHILETGLRFMRSAFVIDNTKKLNVLKEKQNIDWQSIVDQTLKMIVGKNTPLGQAATATKEHFSNFVAPAAQPEEPAVPPLRKTTVKEMDAKKREERMAKLKRTAQATSIRRTSTSGSTASSMGDSGATWGQPSSRTSSSTWGQPASSAPAPGATWGQPASSAPAPGATWGQPANSAPAPAVTWGQPADPAPAGTWGQPAESAPAPAATWGQPSASAAPESNGTWGQQTVKSEPAPAATWGQASAPAPAPASGGSWGQAVKSEPESAATWGQASAPAAAPVSSGSWGQTVKSEPANAATWGQPSAPAPAPAPDASWGQAVKSEPAPAATWGQSSAPAPAPSGTWGQSSDAGPTPASTWGQPAAPAPASTWGQPSEASSSWGNSSTIPDPPRVTNPKLVGKDRGNGPPRTYGSGPGDRSSETQTSSSTHDQGRSWGESQGWNSAQQSSTTSNVGGARGSGGWGNSSSNNVATSHDNQTDAGGGNSYYGSERPSQSDDYDDFRKRRQPSSNNNNDNNKRSRNDWNAPPRDSNPPTGAGRGRGRGQTLPAWMTQGTASMENGTVGGAPSSYNSNNDGPSGMPPGGDNNPSAGRGRGRGRDMNLPAWMTTGGGGGGGDGPPASAPNPYDSRPAPPPVQGGFADPGAGGGGRGRGRTLPAWMTQPNNDSNSGSV